MRAEEVAKISKKNEGKFNVDFYLNSYIFRAIKAVSYVGEYSVALDLTGAAYTNKQQVVDRLKEFGYSVTWGMTHSRGKQEIKVSWRPEAAPEAVQGENAILADNVTFTGTYTFNGNNLVVNDGNTWTIREAETTVTPSTTPLVVRGQEE